MSDQGSSEQTKALMAAGVTTFRPNFFRNTHEKHVRRIARTHRIAQEIDK